MKQFGACSPFASFVQPNSSFAMVNDLRPRPWRYLYAVPITENGVPLRGLIPEGQ